MAVSFAVTATLPTYGPIHSLPAVLPAQAVQAALASAAVAQRLEAAESSFGNHYTQAVPAAGHLTVTEVKAAVFPEAAAATVRTTLVALAAFLTILTVKPALESAYEALAVPSSL